MEFISVILMLYVLYRLIKYILELPYISEYAGKYVLITGCDTGFGHNAVLRLDKLGVNVFAACFTKDGIERLKQETSNRLVIFNIFLLFDFSLISAVKSCTAHSQILARDFIHGSGKLGLIAKNLHCQHSKLMFTYVNNHTRPSAYNTASAAHPRHWNPHFVSCP